MCSFAQFPHPSQAQVQNKLVTIIYIIEYQNIIY